MDVLDDVETEEYRFADRHTAARAWAIAADLCERDDRLRIVSVINEERVPLLIVYDPVTDLRIQFDMVAWILIPDPDGQLHCLYWDQVFAMEHDDVVEHIRTVALLRRYAYLPPSPMAPHVLTYLTFASLLRAGVHDRDGWQIRLVTAAPHDPDTTDDDLLDLFAGKDHLWTILEEDLDEQIQHGATRYVEPVWCLYRGLEPVALTNTIDGTWYTRHRRIAPTAPTARGQAAAVLAATQETPPDRTQPVLRPRTLKNADLGFWCTIGFDEETR
ncbi:TY-Chap2 family putative peptide chaperone [Cellulomonas humilata]|uniref:T3SS peptide-binding chaperone domain-containing protein n=1 Tax=Cellulomonas humilata TaxID=144055 RepID=A0ABU0EL40_9CELL|nr:hypothetical protein [Cellulomonas humilata]MDQ0376001.1 hypothetical protein [Cellulomonas humilata]